MKKVKTSLYINEDLYEEMKEELKDSPHKNMSVFIEHLFQNYRDNNQFVKDSNLEVIKNEMKKIKSCLEVNTQIISSMAENDQLFIGDYYEDNNQYKTAKSVIENRIRSNHLREHVKKADNENENLSAINNTFNFDEY